MKKEIDEVTQIDHFVIPPDPSVGLVVSHILNISQGLTSGNIKVSCTQLREKE